MTRGHERNVAAAPLILVMGMHRSGTSLLGSILQALAVPMPGPLIPGDHHNPEGYFERADITALQEELLIDLDRWWPSEMGTRPLPQNWLASARGQRAAACLRRLLRADLQQQTTPWAIKDPRSSLLLPLWRQVAAELNLPLQLVLAFRDPAEVITSLINRDASRTGMNLGRAQALWLRHHQQVLIDAGGLPLQVVSYSRWFTEPRAQIEALQCFCHPNHPATEAIEDAIARIRPEHRRSRPDQRLSLRVQRWHRQLERAASTGSSDALRHWAVRQRPISTKQPSPHPWSRALRALGSPEASGLQGWQQHGIPSLSLQQLAALNEPGFPGDDPSSTAGPPLPQQLSLDLIGAPLNLWSTHLWIDRLPLSPDTNLLVNSTSHPSQAALHLQPLADTAQDPALLLHLSQRPRVFDPDPAQVRLLRLLGVNAEPLQAAGGLWLNQPGDLPAVSEQLGLPNPAAFCNLGCHTLCLGTDDTISWQQLPDHLLHLPAFPPAPALSSEQARLLASWVSTCLSAGLQLVRLNPTDRERPMWDALAVPCFASPIGPEELLDELAWQQAGRPAPAPIATPTPAAELIWQHESATPAQVAISISSYNYAQRLAKALQSCHAQTLEALELLVVDDVSNDGSLELCRQWLEQHGHRFCRVQLLRHQANSGLAAARNTAFAAATAPWVWVLDADNQLDPQAIERCLQVAASSPDSTAVVHPLIRIVNDAGQPLGLTGGGHPWQREQLRAGNVVDAMALVRRSAWQAVGGYSHIPGGWEDFDFWCKLIEADWHGVLCPQPLATYIQHGDSMLQSQTNRHQRRLSRLLQHRHPWLLLEFANKGR